MARNEKLIARFKDAPRDFAWREPLLLLNMLCYREPPVANRRRADMTNLLEHLCYQRSVQYNAEDEVLYCKVQYIRALNAYATQGSRR